MSLPSESLGLRQTQLCNATLTVGPSTFSHSEFPGLVDVASAEGILRLPQPWLPGAGPQGAQDVEGKRLGHLVSLLPASSRGSAAAHLPLQARPWWAALLCSHTGLGCQ